MVCKVLVMGEVCDGLLCNVFFEVVVVVKIIVEGGEVVGFLIGDSVVFFVNELIYYGVDCVVIVENDKLKLYIFDGYV